MASVTELAPAVGVVAACAAAGVSRPTYYRRRSAPAVRPVRRRPSPPRTLSGAQRQQVRDVLCSERFVDCAPEEVVATLLDEGTYLCSARTMYRILEANGAVRERRNQRVHPAYTKPELLATAPNQVWSWDLTKLRGPQKWMYYYLYVILDIYSRYVVGWMLAHRESGQLASQLFAETCTKQRIEPGQLVVHADRGSAPTAKTLAQLLADLQVTRSFSRPHTSNDNPFSEAHFKTLKYRPDFPARFRSFEHAQAHCRQFFPWYNTEHRHSGIGYLTPEMVHTGRAEHVREKRQAILNRAYCAHPERFVNKRPEPSVVPKAAWINPPENKEQVVRSVA